MSLRTHVAWAGWDEHRFMGYDVFGELAGRQSFVALSILAITGRAPSPAQARALDALAGTVTVADPRIWPLKLVRVASSSGSSLAGLAAGLLAIESDFIGPWTSRGAAADLVALRARVRDKRGAALDTAILRYFEGRGRIIGFGVPFRDVDERVVGVRAQLRRLRRTHLPHWVLAERVWATLRRARRLEPNIGSALSAALLDLDIAPEHTPAVSVVLGLPTLIANAIEGASQAPAALRALPEASIAYVGPRPRRSPRAAVKRR
jgi:citrate synthase